MLSPLELICYFVLVSVVHSDKREHLIPDESEWMALPIERPLIIVNGTKDPEPVLFPNPERFGIIAVDRAGFKNRFGGTKNVLHRPECLTEVSHGRGVMSLLVGKTQMPS